MNEYLLDPNVCTSSLGEDDMPIDPNETAHKWDTTEKPVLCAECGTNRAGTLDYKDIIARMEVMDDDDDTAVLEKTMNYYCSMWDIREGYKYAIRMTLRDQYENHASEQDPDDLEKLMQILDEAE